MGSEKSAKQPNCKSKCCRYVGMGLRLQRPVDLDRPLVLESEV